MAKATQPKLMQSVTRKLWRVCVSTKSGASLLVIRKLLGDHVGFHNLAFGTRQKAEAFCRRVLTEMAQEFDPQCFSFSSEKENRAWSLAEEGTLKGHIYEKTVVEFADGDVTYTEDGGEYTLSRKLLARFVGAKKQPRKGLVPTTSEALPIGDGTLTFHVFAEERIFPKV